MIKTDSNSRAILGYLWAVHIRRASLSFDFLWPCRGRALLEQAVNQIAQLAFVLKIHFACGAALSANETAVIHVTERTLPGAAKSRTYMILVSRTRRLSHGFARIRSVPHSCELLSLTGSRGRCLCCRDASCLAPSPDQ